jgi:hypothetical protein
MPTEVADLLSVSTKELTFKYEPLPGTPTGKVLWFTSEEEAQAVSRVNDDVTIVVLESSAS